MSAAADVSLFLPIKALPSSKCQVDLFSGTPSLERDFHFIISSIIWVLCYNNNIISARSWVLYAVCSPGGGRMEGKIYKKRTKTVGGLGVV